MLTVILGNTCALVMKARGDFILATLSVITEKVNVITERIWFTDT